MCVGSTRDHDGYIAWMRQGLYMIVFERTYRATTHTHTHTHTHTRIIPDYAVTTKSFCIGSSGRLAFRKESELTANYIWWLTKAGDGSQCTLCLPTHLQPHGWERRQGTQPFCNTSRNSLSSPCMRNRWGGAIKWICCYFPRLKMSNLSQRVSQGWLPTQAEANTQHRNLCHANDQLSCFCVIYQIAWACDEWAQISKGGKKDIYFALGRCYAHVTA